jgi:hypothetical protein
VWPELLRLGPLDQLAPPPEPIEVEP